jgi:uncharacterized LabA/DUF88 family protein
LKNKRENKQRENKMEKVAIFIDGSNLYWSLKEQFGRTRIDIGLLSHKVLGNRELTRIYYYYAPLNDVEFPDAARDQRKFLGALSRIDYLEVRLGKLVKRTIFYQCPQCNYQYSRDIFLQKGVDTRIVIDMLRLAMRGLYDTGILISGDADLSEAVQSVKELGKHVENAFTEYGWAHELQRSCDKRVVIDEDFLEDCWLPEHATLQQNFVGR